MRSFQKKFIGLCLFSVLTACHSESDSQKAVDDANKSVEQAKKDADKAETDTTKAAEDAVRTGEEITKSAQDATSCGGQPGSISLSGALVNDESTLDPRVTVDLLAGKGWRGQRPEVNAGVLQLKAKTAPATTQEIEKLKDDNTFVNLGCDSSAYDGVKELQERQIETPSSPPAVIRAKVVLICDGGQIKSNITFITAETVVIADLRYEMTGFLDSIFSVETTKLVIKGDNRIISKSTNGVVTLMQGPSVSISAAEISGNGKIAISAEGSSYQAEAK